MQTKYSIVKDAIKSQILDGTFQPHQKIHSESELMKQFGVSRHTVRLAIDRKSTRLNSSHANESRMPSSA